MKGHQNKGGLAASILAAAVIAIGTCGSAQSAASCRGTKLLHGCTPNGAGDFYYNCYALEVPCSLQKYSLEGVFSPFKYPIVSMQYNVPRAQMLEWQLTER